MPEAIKKTLKTLRNYGKKLGNISQISFSHMKDELLGDKQ